MRLALVLGGLLLAAGAAAGVAAYPPTAGSYYPKCHFHALTGLHCPGCGLTRCGYALVTGRPELAARANLFGVVLLPLAALASARAAVRWVRATPRPRRPTRTWFDRHGTAVALTVAGLLLGYGVLRNLPAAPFTWLAPPEVGE